MLVRRRKIQDPHEPRRKFQTTDDLHHSQNMSYAGPAKTRSKQASSRSNAAKSSSSTFKRTLAEDVRETDWRQLAVFGAGLALGIALGAGAAMLTAPQSGEETRADLTRGARRATRMVGRRSLAAWEDLRDDLRGATRALRRRKAQRAADRALHHELARESERELRTE